MPSFLTLIELFWPWTLLRDIVLETNCYASTINEDRGQHRGSMTGKNRHLIQS